MQCPQSRDLQQQQQHVSLTCRKRKQTLKICVCKYVYQHRVIISPFEAHLFMQHPAAQFFWKTPIFKKLLKFKH